MMFFASLFMAFSLYASAFPAAVPVDVEVVSGEDSTVSVTDGAAPESDAQSDALTVVDGEEPSVETVWHDVVRVVDGDTFSVKIDGVLETIRVIGINTPETVDPRRPVECFGEEASNRAKALLSGKRVQLVIDTSQGERDKYDRLLRYTTLEDGADFGEQMIAGGYAYEYTYRTPYEKQSMYKQAQNDAQTAGRGLWAADACGDVTSATPTPTPAPSATTAPATAPTASCSCSANTLNCGDFSTHAAAQAYYECCMTSIGADVHKLDGSDNDGLACESLS